MPINSQFPRPRAAAAPNPATLSTVLSALFAPEVAAAELRQAGDCALLYPAEALNVSNAVPKRVGEFAAGRLCARRALAQFGITGFALNMAADRLPVWPDSIVGSITHTQGFGAAVVAERRHFASLGLDVEAAGGVKRELWRHICVPAESDWLASLPEAARACAATLVFSAKEAFYKCQYPVTRQRMSFADLCLTLPGSQAGEWSGAVATVIATPTRPLAISAGREPRFEGSYRLHDGYICAGFHLPAAREFISPTGSEPIRSTAATD